MAACPNCGARNDADARFCKDCGAALMAPAPAAVAAATPARRRRSKRWPFFVIAGVLLLILLFQLLGSSLLVLALAVIPAAFYVSLFLWIDRYEPEPRWMLAGAFLWGASGAILISGSVNAIFGLSFGDAATARISAPIIEESTKGAVLLAIYLWKRHELDSLLDAIVYAAMVGLGFAMAENIQYYGSALREGELVQTFVLRGIIRPFGHPLYTMLTGIGLILALRSSDRRVKIGAPIVGLLAAMLLHSFWNTMAGVNVFLGLLIFVPVFIAAGLLVRLAAKRDRAIIARYAPGVLGPAAEVAPLYSLRSQARDAVGTFRKGGIKALRARDDYVRDVSEAAFESYRAAQRESGVPPPSTGQGRLSIRELWRLLLPEVPK